MNPTYKINIYEYDDRNRLIKVITATQTVLYSYDANNNRIAKSMDNEITRYLVDANTIEELPVQLFYNGQGQEIGRHTGYIGKEGILELLRKYNILNK